MEKIDGKKGKFLLETVLSVAVAQRFRNFSKVKKLWKR